jgi:hypothetical protein
VTGDDSGIDTQLARLLYESGAVTLGPLQRALVEARAKRTGDDDLLLAQILVEQQLISEELAQSSLEELRGPVLNVGVRWNVGATVAGYRLEEELGRGGMGVVFRGLHLESGREVAIKTITSAADEELLRRFEREGQAQAAADGHPNVLTVHSAGRAGGQDYLVLDLATGGDLSARLRKRGRLPEREAADMVRQLARGLAHVHAQGVLHRDLKPQNVVFDEADRPQLVDFGLARVDPDRSSLTHSFMVLGTPSYMAPELVESPLAVDEQSDLYSLGALLYHALSGEPPYGGESSMEVLTNVLTSSPRPIRSLAADVSPALEAICAHAMARDPQERCPSAEALADSLEAWLAGEAPPRFRRSLWVGIVGALALLAFALAGTDRREPDVPRSPADSAWTAAWAADRSAFEVAIRELAPEAQRSLRAQLQATWGTSPGGLVLDPDAQGAAALAQAEECLARGWTSLAALSLQRAEGEDFPQRWCRMRIELARGSLPNDSQLQALRESCVEDHQRERVSSFCAELGLSSGLEAPSPSRTRWTGGPTSLQRARRLWPDQASAARELLGAVPGEGVAVAEERAAAAGSDGPVGLSLARAAGLARVAEIGCERSVARAAREELRALEHIRPHSCALWAGRVRSSLVLHDLPAAQRACASLIALAPDDPEAALLDWRVQAAGLETGPPEEMRAEWQALAVRIASSETRQRPVARLWEAWARLHATPPLSSEIPNLPSFPFSSPAAMDRVLSARGALADALLSAVPNDLAARSCELRLGEAYRGSAREERVQALSALRLQAAAGSPRHARVYMALAGDLPTRWLLALRRCEAALWPGPGGQRDLRRAREELRHGLRLAPRQPELLLLRHLGLPSEIGPDTFTDLALVLADAPEHAPRILDWLQERRPPLVEGSLQGAPLALACWAASWGGSARRLAWRGLEAAARSPIDAASRLLVALCAVRTGSSAALPEARSALRWVRAHTPWAVEPALAGLEGASDLDRALALGAGASSTQAWLGVAFRAESTFRVPSEALRPLRWRRGEDPPALDAATVLADQAHFPRLNAGVDLLLGWIRMQGKRPLPKLALESLALDDPALAGAVKAERGSRSGARAAVRFRSPMGSLPGPGPRASANLPLALPRGSTQPLASLGNWTSVFPRTPGSMERRGGKKSRGAWLSPSELRRDDSRSTLYVTGVRAPSVQEDACDWWGAAQDVSSLALALDRDAALCRHRGADYEFADTAFEPVFSLAWNPAAPREVRDAAWRLLARAAREIPRVGRDASARQAAHALRASVALHEAGRLPVGERQAALGRAREALLRIDEKRFSASVQDVYWRLWRQARVLIFDPSRIKSTPQILENLARVLSLDGKRKPSSSHVRLLRAALLVDPLRPALEGLSPAYAEFLRKAARRIR